MWRKLITRRVASGLKEGLEEAQRREQLKREHIDTAKEYAQTLKNATTTAAKDIKNIVTGKPFLNPIRQRRKGGTAS